MDAAIAAAPREALTVILLHHHVLPLPEESFPERLATRLGWPHAAELALGAELVSRVQGRCDLILHGHRHVPREFDLGRPERAGPARLQLGQLHGAGPVPAVPARGGPPARCPGVAKHVGDVPAPRTASHNVLPALQYLASQLGTALF